MTNHDSKIIKPTIAGSFAWFATACGLISALAYTAANICLRSVTGCDPIWVSAVKSFPTVMLVGPWIAIQALQRQRVLPDRKTLSWLILAAILGQIGGNVTFQWSLGVIGIALTVPITLGTMILTGALLGRAVLGEPITPRTLFSIVCLVAAISILSFGAGDAYQSVVGDGQLDILATAIGVASAAMAGVAYATLGVVIRYGVTGRSSLSTTIFTVGVVGTIVLGGISLGRIGWQAMYATEADEFGVMLAAGVCNALAFAALTKALQLTTVVYVNALNATQATMAAVAGVFIFQEAPTSQMRIGVLLTIAGLVLMRKYQRKEPVLASNDEMTDR